MLFSQEQRFFLKFQRGDIINSDSDSEDEDIIDSDTVLEPLYSAAHSSNAKLLRAKEVVKRHLKDMVNEEGLKDAINKRIIDGVIHEL